LEKIGVTQDEYTKPFVKNILDVPISLYGIRIREREKFFHTPVWDL
jgi:hypothetical protein